MDALWTVASSVAVRMKGGDRGVTNRRPVHVEVRGDGDAFTRWAQLKRSGYFLVRRLPPCQSSWTPIDSVVTPKLAS